MNSTDGSTTSNDFIYSATNVASVLACLVAAILVFCLQLHKKVVYRLALYQVLSSLALALAEISQLIFLNYSRNPKLYDEICVAIGWFDMFSLWMKLLFTLWATFHLFCFAVFHWNLKRLEVLYVATSLIVPALIASVPLTTQSYGFSPVDGCYIPAYDGNRTLHEAIIERFSIWDGPAMIILLAESAAMVTMVIKLTHRVYRYRESSQQESITSGGRRDRDALKQLLPLAAYPILFLVFIVPVLVYDVFYCFITPTPDDGLVLSDYLFISLWSLSSAMAVIVHIFVSQIPGRFRALWARRHKETVWYNSLDHTIRLDSELCVNSATSFRLPKCSIDTCG